MRILICLIVLLWAACAARAEDRTSVSNTFTKVSENAIGPRTMPALVWDPELARYLLVGGRISHHFKGERPWDEMTFDPEQQQWFNQLPPGAEELGGATGNVEDPGYQSPYFAMEDKLGMTRPNRRHAVMHYQYARAPWDGKLYALVCGHTLRYDPQERAWVDLKPERSPVPLSRSYKGTLNWGALCADPVNKELLLFGGCGVPSERADPGTWVYSTEKNEWRELAVEVQPPQRALAPMVYDPTTKKIVLFGGDHLSHLWADTWVYDCATRTWEERKPALSPAPRFAHALLYAPKAGKVVLLGGSTYTSSLSYCATLYRSLPFEIWTYDVADNSWALIKHYGGDDEKDLGEADGAPRLRYGRGDADVAATAAIDDQDRVLWIGGGTEKKSPHSTWLATLDLSQADAAGTEKHGVAPGTEIYRTGPFDPAWYEEDVPEPDPAATAAFYAQLPANRLVEVEAPKWPINRMGGGWSTVALDSDRDLILHLGGGHSSYFGNDVAIFDLKTHRWSISNRPMFALHYNYDLSGPGPHAFNRGPWGNHNYHAYAYDPLCKRLVYMKSKTFRFDPDSKAWAFDDQRETPWSVSKYTTYVVSTPRGLVAWAPDGRSRDVGIYRFEDGDSWRRLEVTGELPMVVCDGSAAAYDGKRDRLLMVSTTKDEDRKGQVWVYDFKSGEVGELNPSNMGAIRCGRFAREAVYLPEDDLVMLGFLLQQGEQLVVPFYDCAANKWQVAEVPGADVLFNNGKPGSSVDLGLQYDAKRKLVWAVRCNLDPGSVGVLRIDRANLKLVDPQR